MLLLALLLGYLLGRLQNRRWRRDRYVSLARKIQLIAERNENLGLRRKGRRPSLRPSQKWLLGLLHWLSPTLSRYTLFHPQTLLGWHRRYVKKYWWLISGKPGGRRVGRPRIDKSIEQIILHIKAENPSYGAERIAALVTEQLGVAVSESTVRNVLKRNPPAGDRQVNRGRLSWPTTATCLPRWTSKSPSIGAHVRYTSCRSSITSGGVWCGAAAHGTRPAIGSRSRCEKRFPSTRPRP